MARTKQTVLNGNTGGDQKYQNGTTVASIGKQDTTDIQRWRLLDEAGRQTWYYLETDEKVKAWPQSTADRYHLGLPLVNSTPPQLFALVNAIDMSFSGPPGPPDTQDSALLRPECPLLLLPPAAPPWQLGLRIWRSHVPPARHGHCLVRHSDTYTRTCRYRNEEISFCTAKSR